MENISSLRQLEIFTLSMTQAHSMGKGGDYLKKFMPAHRPYGTFTFVMIGTQQFLDAHSRDNFPLLYL